MTLAEYVAARAVLDRKNKQDNALSIALTDVRDHDPHKISGPLWEIREELRKEIKQIIEGLDRLDFNQELKEQP